MTAKNREVGWVILQTNGYPSYGYLYLIDNRKSGAKGACSVLQAQGDRIILFFNQTIF